jgi:hypothetical protein
MEPDEEVVAAEFKINLLLPAVGRRIVAEAQVVRAGRTLVISEVTVSAVVDERLVRVAMMLQTNLPREDVSGESRVPLTELSVKSWSACTAIDLQLFCVAADNGSRASGGLRSRGLVTSRDLRRPALVFREPTHQPRTTNREPQTSYCTLTMPITGVMRKRPLPVSVTDRSPSKSISIVVAPESPTSN